MAQSAQTVTGDPITAAGLIQDIIDAGNTILEIEKTFSAGTFVVIVDDTAGGQTCEVYIGDPDTVSAALDTLAGSSDIDVLSGTFSGSHYLVVYT